MFSALKVPLVVFHSFHFYPHCVFVVLSILEHILKSVFISLSDDCVTSALSGSVS